MLNHSGRTAAAMRAVLMGGAALCCALPLAAHAQSAPASDEALPAPPAAAAPAATEGAEIVVTATKRSQSLQSVPVAVSVVGADTIEKAHIQDIQDLASVVPSLRVVPHAEAAQTDFYIRGFGNGSNNAGIEPSVGVFIDGVYRSRSAAQIEDFPDVSRVEVLRGPQSTLFGKNASAGVISITTAEPQFKLGGNFEATYGNYNDVVLKGAITGPVSQTLAVSIAGAYDRRDGYTHDLGTGADVNNRNRWFVRGQALYEPDSQLKVRIIADYGKIDERCCTTVNVLSGPTAAIIAALGGQTNAASNPFGNVVYDNLNSTNDIANYGVSGQVDYTLGPIKITSITAWRKSHTITNQDADFSSADLLGAESDDLAIRTFTQELRAATTLDGPLNFLVGAFFMDEHIADSGQLLYGSQFRPYANALIQQASGGALNVNSLEYELGALQGNGGLYTGQFFAQGQGLNEGFALQNDAGSIFAQMDFKPTSRLTLTGGIDYTRDVKHFSTNTTSTDVFSGVNLSNPAFYPLRQQLLVGQGLLNAGVNPTNTAQVTAFATNPSTAPIYQQILAYGAANASNPNLNPLAALHAFQFLPPFLNVPNAVEPGRTSDGNVSFTARAAYEFTPKVRGYLSVATGFKASSVNLSRDSRPALADEPAIVAGGLALANLSYGSRFAGPEKSTVFEAGLKTNWGVASFNLAVFREIIKGFQSNLFTGIGFDLANAGQESVNGIEFEGMVHPTPELTISESLTYLRPRYDSFVNSSFGDVSGMTPAGIPPISSTIGIMWNQPFGNGNHLILRGDWHYESQTQIEDGLPGEITSNPYTGAVISYQTGIAAARPFTRTVSEIDGSLTWTLRGGMSLSLWGRNLTDDRYLTVIFDTPAQNGSVSGYPNQPRTYGVSALYKF